MPTAEELGAIPAEESDKEEPTEQELIEQTKNQYERLIQQPSISPPSLEPDLKKIQTALSNKPQIASAALSELLKSGQPIDKKWQILLLHHSPPILKQAYRDFRDGDGKTLLDIAIEKEHRWLAILFIIDSRHKATDEPALISFFKKTYIMSMRKKTIESQVLYIKNMQTIFSNRPQIAAAALSGLLKSGQPIDKEWLRLLLQYSTEKLKQAYRDFRDEDEKTLLDIAIEHKALGKADVISYLTNPYARLQFKNINDDIMLLVKRFLEPCYLPELLYQTVVEHQGSRSDLLHLCVGFIDLFVVKSPKFREIGDQELNSKKYLSLINFFPPNTDINDINIDRAKLKFILQVISFAVSKGEKNADLYDVLLSIWAKVPAHRQVIMASFGPNGPIGLDDFKPGSKYNLVAYNNGKELTEKVMEKVSEDSGLTRWNLVFNNLYIPHQEFSLKQVVVKHGIEKEAITAFKKECGFEFNITRKFSVESWREFISKNDSNASRSPSAQIVCDALRFETRVCIESFLSLCKPVGSPVIISGEGSKRIRTTSENNSGVFMLSALGCPRLSALVLSFLYEPYLHTSLAFAKSQGVFPLPAQVQAQPQVQFQAPAQPQVQVQFQAQQMVQAQQVFQSQPQAPIAAQAQTSHVCDGLLAEPDYD